MKMRETSSAHIAVLNRYNPACVGQPVDLQLARSVLCFFNRITVTKIRLL